MVESTLAYLIVNNSFVLAGAIVAMFRSSNCSKLLCGRCLEIDNIQHTTDTVQTYSIPSNVSGNPISLQESEMK